MPKPTILVFSTAYFPFIGGAEIAIQEITRRLQDHYNFIVITARLKRHLQRHESLGGVKIVRVGLGCALDKWWLPFGGFLTGFACVRKRGKHGNFLLWGMDISQGSLAAVIFKIFFPRIPFLFTVQYGYGEERIARGRGGGIAKALRWILESADNVVCISKHLEDIVKQHHYYGPTILIHNGVDSKRFSHRTEETPSPKKDIVITISRLVHKNGLDVLIHAIANLRKKGMVIQCHIIGEGPERKKLEELARELDIEKEIIFFGKVAHEDIPKYLHKAKVFVRASRTEGLGNAFLEALAAGVPIIGTPVGGILDIIEDKKTGLLAKTDDYHDVAKKIEQLLSDNKLARDIVENGKRMLRDRFEWDGISQRYADIFLQLLSTQKRILIATGLYPPEIGGPATYSALLLRGLSNYGIAVCIVPYREVRRLPKILRHLAYFFKVLKKSRGRDIIFAQDPVSVGFPSVVAAKIAQKKYMLKIVGDYAWEQGVQKFGVNDMLDEFLEKKYSWRVELLRNVQRYTAHSADLIITPSKYLKRVVSQWGVKAEKIFVVPNSIEENLGSSASKEEARKLLDIRGFVLVSVGRLVPWKGFETLVEVISLLKEKIPDIQLFIIGSGPQREFLSKKIHALQLDDYVVIKGQLDRETVRSFLLSADIFVLNTAYEGMSHAIIEAMSAGVPVVTTHVGGNTEVIENNHTGLLVRYNDLQELRGVISKLHTNRQLREFLAGNAKKAVATFNTETMLDKTAHLIKIL